MATYVYDDFRVAFVSRADETFDVVATGPDGAVTTGSFTLPLDGGELQQALLRVARSNTRKAMPANDPAPRRDIGGDTAPVFDAEQIGALLGESLLSGDVGAAYERALRASTEDEHGLRLSLSLAEAPSLLSVPWEFLYRRPRFLASQRHTPLVRWLDTGALAAPPAIDATVRILGVIASPHELAHLDVAAERERVEQAIEKVREHGRVELDWLEPATPRSLRTALRDGSYHILHYVGHSDFTPAGDGVLFLEDADGAAEEIDSTALANLLSDQTVLRLVVLNSCEGARTTIDDPYAGVATTLVQLGVPAVIAMQFPISDDVAILFAEELYTNLIGRQDPIDAAVAEARKAIYIELDKVEWATPVLFVRDPEVELFRFQLPAAPLPPPPPPQLPALEELPPAASDEPAPPPPPVEPSEPATGERPRRRRLLVAAAATVVLGVAAAAVAVLVSGGDDGDDGDAESADATTPASVKQQQPPPAPPTPRPRSESLIAMVQHPSEDVSLLLVDSSGNVSDATTQNGSRDREPDWDPATNRVAFARNRATTKECDGICYLVPGKTADDPGIPATQLVPVDASRREHDPSWARDGALYYAISEECETPNECDGEIRRTTFEASADAQGFADVLTPAGDDALVFSGLTGIRDLDADPHDELRIAVATLNDIVLIRDGSVEQTLPASAGAAQVTYTPDGSHIVAVSADEQLAIWGRDGTPVDVPAVGDLVAASAEQTGQPPSLSDPSTAVVHSISPADDGSDAVVLVGDPDHADDPVGALLHVDEGGNPIFSEVQALPSDLTTAGTVRSLQA